MADDNTQKDTRAVCNSVAQTMVEYANDHDVNYIVAIQSGDGVTYRAGGEVECTGSMQTMQVINAGAFMQMLSAEEITMLIELASKVEKRINGEEEKPEPSRIIQLNS